MADAVSVFAGEKFLYSTGNYIDVDGGFHIRRLLMIGGEGNGMKNE